MERAELIQKRKDSYYSKLEKKVREDGTFAAKSHQKEALDYLNRIYDFIKETAQQTIFESPSKFDFDIWVFPFDLYAVKEKHYPYFKQVLSKEEYEELLSLVQLRKTFKEIPVVKPVKSDDAEQKEIERIEKSIQKIRELTAENYNRALELKELFGGIPVSISDHYVTNSYGTTFRRTFYYVLGRITPLKVIMAAMQDDAKKMELLEE